MSRLIESIKLLDGKFCNLVYHEKRMMHALAVLFGVRRPVRLEKLLNETDLPPRGLFKCRILYDARAHEITFESYQPRRIRSIKLVEDNSITYPFKFADRTAINRLFDLRGVCDDIMIIRNGRVTDCSYSNVVFRKGREWFTPDTPLLEGTMRAKLIAENKITVREILRDNIRSFDSLKIINAMLEFDGPEIEVSDLVF